MSANKGFDTKVEYDDNTDSGFLSGPIDRLPDQVEDEGGEESDSKIVKSEESDPIDLDSGLDLCLSQRLDSLRVEDATPTALHPPKVTVTEEASSELPPLAILFQQDDDGDTQLHIAAVHGCQRSVSTLIRVCPDKYWLDLPNDFGQSALHLAVMSGNAVVARMLVQAGSSLGVRDLDGNTPIHAATAAKHVDCLQALLAPIEKNILPKQLLTILNLKNYDGQTAVHVAATSGHIQSLQTLVYYGANVNAREGLAGWTPLHVAARRGDVRLAQYLLERCAGVASRTRDYAGRTPRRLAKRNPAFSTKDGAKLFKATAEDSDSETDSEDEYDSDDAESLFEKIRGSMSAAVVTTN